MNTLLLPTAPHRDASVDGSVRSMPMSMSMKPMSKWSTPRNLTGAAANPCMFTSNHCTFTGIYGAKRVATGSLPEGLT